MLNILTKAQKWYKHTMKVYIRFLKEIKDVKKSVKRLILCKYNPILSEICKHVVCFCLVWFVLFQNDSLKIPARAILKYFLIVTFFTKTREMGHI